MVEHRDLLQAVGRALAARRLAQGMTQAELAAACELQPAHISAIETGVRNSTLITLFRVTRRLDWKLSDLFAEAGH